MKNIDRVIFDAKISDRKILLIPADTITATPYNPQSRTKEGKVLQRLVSSIKKYGLIQPLIITSERDLVDGNRRLAAAKLAGCVDVECIILSSNVDKDEVFCTVNTTAEKIGGKGWLEACRHGYKTPPPAIQAQYEELFRLVGLYGVDMLIEKKIGFNILALCKGVKSIGVAERLDSLIIKVAKNKLTNKINFILRSGVTREEKVAAFKSLLSDDSRKP